tara:strand:- start:255 stop:626 length:372 start_codon:yes stop_codon:yes gene_type:complete
MNSTTPDGPRQTVSAGPPPPPIQNQCRKCRQPIGGNDAFCRYCGTRQQVTDPFYYHPISILLLAFFVLGPFALGLVWRSQSMDRTMKIILAILILTYSAASFYALYVVGMAMYQELSALNQIL